MTRRAIWSLSVLGMVLALLFPAASAWAQACNAPPGAQALRAQLLDEVNGRRTRAGLSRLSQDPRLEEAAALVACDNARRNRMSHTTADGSDLTRRMRAVGYRFRGVNENITTRPTAAAAVQSWMGSTQHRNNMLAGQMRHFGAGVARSASGQIYWVMVSARPR